MKKDILTNAYFGQAFTTRDGGTAVFLGKWILESVHGNKDIYKCWIEGNEEPTEYDCSGLSWPDESRCVDDNGAVEEWDADIIGVCV